MNILQEADRLVNGPRQDYYDHPSKNFGRISVLWGAYILASGIGSTRGIEPRDVPALNILQKIAREMYRHKSDNLVDIAGYAQTIEMLYDEEEE